MSLELTAEQLEFQSSLRKLCNRTLTSAYLRRRMESAESTDTALWRELGELGVLLAPAKEEHGGLGLGFREVALVAFECGRSLMPEPLAQNILAGPYALSRLVPEPPPQLEAILAGNVRVALLDAGNAKYVAGAECSDWLLVTNGEKCFWHETKSCTVIAQPTLDRILKRATVTLAKGQPLAINATQLRNLWAVITATEIAGACEKVLEITTDFVKTRKQFDVPVGGFQAVAHKLAASYANAQALRALCHFAAWAADHSPEQLPLAAQSALIYACEHGPRIIEDAIQLSGGIGFTWEYDLHLYLRRVRALVAVHGGDAIDHASLLQAVG